MMNCKLHDPTLPDNDSLCEYCRYTLAPLQEWMAELTGDSEWRNDLALMDNLYGPEIKQVKSFLAGGRFAYAVVENTGFGQRKAHIEAVDTAPFDYVLPEEVA